MIYMRALVGLAVGLPFLATTQTILADDWLSTPMATSTPVFYPSETATSTPTVVPDDKPVGGLDTVQIGFQNAMNKYELEYFIMENEVKPVAFFYHINGLGGTVREYNSVEGRSHREIVKIALDKILKNRKTAEAGEVMLARQFAKKYSLGRVLNSNDSAELQDRLRYLLDTRMSRLEDISDLENGLPVIYGMEVRVNTEKREQLYTNINTRYLLSREIVRSYRDAKSKREDISKFERAKYSGSILPSEYKARNRNAHSENLMLSVEEMYKRLVDISKIVLPVEKGNE